MGIAQAAPRRPHTLSVRAGKGFVSAARMTRRGGAFARASRQDAPRQGGSPIVFVPVPRFGLSARLRADRQLAAPGRSGKIYNAAPAAMCRRTQKINF